jgi:hypothetical protein
MSVEQCRSRIDTGILKPDDPAELLEGHSVEPTGLRLAARLRPSQQIATRVTADTRHSSDMSHLFRNLASGSLTAF